MIRPAERDDIPAIVEMHLRIFGPPRGASATDDLDYETIFFDSPWYDPEIRSLMFESDGHIVGFMGIAARPMEFQGRQIRVAIPTRFMVDAEKGGALVAVQLLKTLAAGPQEAAINDGSNEVMREVWLKSGAELMVANSTQWVRSLQPAERLRRSTGARGGIAGLASRLALPFGWAADAVLDRAGWNDFSAAEGLKADSTLEAAELLPLIEKESGRCALSPTYDESTLGWQLGEMRRMARHRDLRCAIVRKKNGKPAGWYMYYHDPDDVSEVLQLVASPRQEEAVLAMLLADASERGVIAIRGRVDVRFMHVLKQQRCFFTVGQPWSLVMSKNAELRAALQGKDAFFTRLEGEWW
jgi:hypothetical protein